MMYSNSAPVARSTRIWRPDPSVNTAASDGPIVVLREMVSSAREHKLTLIVCTAVGLLVAALYAHSLPQMYTASSTLLLEPHRQATASGWEATSSQGLDVNRADSELQVIRSERLLRAVFDSLDLQNSEELGPGKPSISSEITGAIDYLFRGGERKPSRDAAVLMDEKRQIAFGNFSQRLTARRVGQSYAIEIEYASQDPALALRVANSAASAYILQSVAYKVEIAKTGTEFLQGRIDNLTTQAAAANDAMIHGTLPKVPTPDADGRIIGAAQLPLSPSSPRTRLIIAFGGIVGLIAGMAFVGLTVIFDRKVNSAKKLTRLTGLPCLGIVPELRQWKGMRRQPKGEVVSVVSSKPRSAFAMAIRDLHTSIELASPIPQSGGGAVIAVAGWKSATGVSTLCANLAQVMHRNGRHVTIFTTAEADDGHQSLQSNVTIPPSLIEALSLDTELDLVAYSNSDGVAVLPIFSTNVDLDLSFDFRDPRLKRIIDVARSMGDVLLDLPPLSRSADGAALAQFSDAVVLVTRFGDTTHDDVTDAVDRLLRAETNVIGTVINRSLA